nr:K300 [uncultured bacterium]
MLNDIAFGPFLEQPAGKDAPPFPVAGAAHVQLDEGAGFGRVFPWRGRLAGLQSDDGVADAERLAGLHRQVAGQAVALVEQADHGHPLRHRRAGQAGLAAGLEARSFHPHRSGRIAAGKLVAAATGRKQQQKRQDDSRRRAIHDASGLHAS